MRSVNAEQNSQPKVALQLPAGWLIPGSVLFGAIAGVLGKVGDLHGPQVLSALFGIPITWIILAWVAGLLSRRLWAGIAAGVLLIIWSILAYYIYDAVRWHMAIRHQTGLILPWVALSIPVGVIAATTGFYARTNRQIAPYCAALPSALIVGQTVLQLSFSPDVSGLAAVAIVAVVVTLLMKYTRLSVGYAPYVFATVAGAAIYFGVTNGGFVYETLFPSN